VSKPLLSANPASGSASTKANRRERSITVAGKRVTSLPPNGSGHACKRIRLIPRVLKANRRSATGGGFPYPVRRL